MRCASVLGPLFVAGALLQTTLGSSQAAFLGRLRRGSMHPSMHSCAGRNVGVCSKARCSANLVEAAFADDSEGRGDDGDRGGVWAAFAPDSAGGSNEDMPCAGPHCWRVVSCLEQSPSVRSVVSALVPSQVSLMPCLMHVFGLRICSM